MSEQQTVEYRDIPGFPGYRIGNDGSVWSMVGLFGRASQNWRCLKLSCHSAGYPVVGLRAAGERMSKGKVRAVYVHRLVLEVFVGACPEGMECCHRDGNPSNNHIGNLYWGTPTENAADSARHGTKLRGSRKPNVKLHEDDIPLIRALARRGFSTQCIADLFNVHPRTIRAVLAGDSWSHVPEPSLTPEGVAT